MSRRGRTIAVIVGALLGIGLAVLLAQPAVAVPRDQLPAMEQVASEYYGGLPACGQPVIEFVPYGSLDGDDRPGVGVAGRGSQAQCKIWLDERVFENTWWPEACAIVVHELGHVHGLVWGPGEAYVDNIGRVDPDHHADPNHIMHRDAPKDFAPCVAADPYRPQWEAAEAEEDRLWKAANAQTRRCDRLEARAWRARKSRKKRAARRALRRCDRKLTRIEKRWQRAHDWALVAPR